MALAAIPGEVWAMIEAVINTYRLRKERRSTAMLPSEVRQELMRISARTGTLLKWLFELKAAQPVDMMLSFPNQLQALGSVELSLMMLADEIKPGTKDRNAYALVSTLAGIMFEVTGRPITRSHNRTNVSFEYIKLLCNAADLGIGDGTIAHAMQDCIKRHRLREVPEEDQRVN